MIHWVYLSNELSFFEHLQRLNCLYTLNYNRRAFFPEEVGIDVNERERRALNRLTMNEYENAYLWP